MSATDSIRRRLRRTAAETRVADGPSPPFDRAQMLMSNARADAIAPMPLFRNLAIAFISRSLSAVDR
jgi:hypothetical protein